MDELTRERYKKANDQANACDDRLFWALKRDYPELAWDADAENLSYELRQRARYRNTMTLGQKGARELVGKLAKFLAERPDLIVQSLPPRATWPPTSP